MNKTEYDLYVKNLQSEIKDWTKEEKLSMLIGSVADNLKNTLWSLDNVGGDLREIQKVALTKAYGMIEEIKRITSEE